MTRDRAPLATGFALGADEGAEIEHRLPPLPSVSSRHRAVRERLCLAPCHRRARQRPRDEPSRVGVDETDVSLRGEHQDGARRIRTDARKREQRRDVVGQLPAMALADRDRGNGGG